MSVLNRQANPSKDRDVNDFYPTKTEFAYAHVDYVISNRYWYSENNKILDVGIGHGMYGYCIDESIGNDRLTGELNRNFKVFGIDINEEFVNEYNKYYDTCYHGDFLDCEFGEKFDLIIGNPPYKNVQKFVERGLGLLERGGQLSFLLKGSYLESLQRYDFFNNIKRPSSVYIFAQRPIKNHAEMYCVVNFHNNYYDDSVFNSPTFMGWIKVNGMKDYEVI